MKQFRTSRYLENQAIEWLVKLNNPAISQQEQDAFQKWLSQSPEHQLAYIKAEALWSVSAKAVTANKPGYFVHWRYAFASLVLVLCGSWFYLSSNKIETTDYITAIGEKKEIVLSDGSTVNLNNQTHIRVSISDSERHVDLLQGEALFQVTVNPKKPFDIDTGDGVVRVLGTRFSVNRYDESTLVTVVEGRVALGQKPLTKDDVFIALQVLTDSQQQSMSGAFAGKQPEIVNPQNELAWEENRLIYKGAELRKVIRDLERIYPIKIQLKDSALGSRKMTAVLNIASLDQVIAVIESSLSLHAERSATEIILSEKK